MPISNYDDLFGGKQGAAAKAAMVKKRGLKEGTALFYKTVNSRRGRNG